MKSCAMLLCSLAQLAPQADAIAQGKPARAVTKQSAVADVHRPFWSPNRIGTYMNNIGLIADYQPTGSAATEWPVGSGNTIIFASGLWLSGMKNGEVVCAAAEFGSEFQPGNVTGWAPGVEGTPADPDDPRYKVYIINQEDTLNTFANEDFLNWPAAQGAPVDRRGRPRLVGTSTAWAVFNDFDQSRHDNVFQSKIMGVEVQMTAWAFNFLNALQDMLFFKYVIINKSGADITAAYTGFWADSDIGDAVDLVGCDPALSLGFNFKTQKDGQYGDNPPAVGYKLLQGPIVPAEGDTALVSGRDLRGYRNLPMTAFFKYIGGGPPQWSDPENAAEVYNHMRGLDIFGDPIIDPTTGRPTTFWHPGDPVAGTGWLDNDHRDKRFLMSSGPLTLADGDTQEVVLGIIVAQGKTGLESVTLLKRNAQIAQYLHDTNYATPVPPPAPIVTVYPDTASVLLTWSEDAEAFHSPDFVDRDTLGETTAYTFQGYNVYQLDGPVITPETKVKKLATFDIIDGVGDIEDRIFVPELGRMAQYIVQKAEDSGVQRFFRVRRNVFSDDFTFIKNQPYYFAVTAYAYNPFGVGKVLESPLLPVEVRLQDPPPGTQLTTPIGDTLKIEHIGPGAGSVYPIVIAPEALQTRSYRVVFRTTDEMNIVWDLIAADERKVAGWENQGSQGNFNFPIVDGILVQVFSPPVGIRKVEREFEGGPRWISGTNWGGSHFFGGMDLGVNFFGSTLRPADYVVVDWKFTSNPEKSEATGWMRCYVYRRDLGYAAVAERGWAPFQAFDMSDSTNPRQLNVCFVEMAGTGLADLIWNPIAAEQAGGDPGGREYTFIMLSSYDPDGNLYDDENHGLTADVLYVLWPNNRGSHPYQEADFTMRIIPNFVNTERDTFTFRSEAPVRNDLALARKQAAALVNVFPNPVNRGLIDLRHPLDKKVTFTHLPLTGVVIRIYSLAGDLIRTIEHDNGTQFDFWDLRNANGRAVASGVYLVHVDMGEVGVKVLKVVVL